MLSRSILLCMGTRPEIIKMAPVYHELLRRGMDPVILHTGQHLAMAEQMYRFFDLKPDLVLDLGTHRETLALLSAALLEKVGDALSRQSPSAVLVHGDTSSAVMAALAAFYQKIPVGHVEAGLRSHSSYDPFPEEKNREMVARLASWHFAPTEQAVRNLLREGVPAEAISMVGNTIVDAVNLATNITMRDGNRADSVLPPELSRLQSVLAPGRRLAVVTSHRRENVEGPLHGIAGAVRDLLTNDPDLVVVWPVHANPKVQSIVRSAFADVSYEVQRRLFLCEPLDYPALIWLLRHAWLVLTDSGGIQEEAASLHVPILVLRDTTERPELISSGGGVMVGTDRKRIAAEVNRMAADPAIPDKMRAARNPFGDGRAAVRIADVLSRDLTDRIAA
jgi:UDP-N-acetylglucosamine 2-epimerase (non-hydrolysing)